jgi:hypothetical protein
VARLVLFVFRPAYSIDDQMLEFINPDLVNPRQCDRTDRDHKIDRSGRLPVEGDPRFSLPETTM